jgi:hypothetical protein
MPESKSELTWSNKESRSGWPVLARGQAGRRFEGNCPAKPSNAQKTPGDEMASV